MGDATDRFGDAHFAAEQSPQLALAYGYVSTYENGTRAYYTSHDAPLVVANCPAAIGGGTRTFTPAQISHGPTEVGLGYSPTTVDVTVTTAVEKIRKIAATTAATNHKIHIVRFSVLGLSTDQAAELDYDDHGMIVFGGIGEAYSLVDESISVTVAPEPFAVDRAIPRYYAQRQCNHVLFDQATCKVTKASFTFAVTTDAAVRSQRRVFRHAVVGATWSYFHGGHAVHVPTGLIFQIEWGGYYDSDSKTFWQLSHWSPDIADGDAWIFYPGCNRTTGDCVTKFANGANFGGFPYVPNQNPVLHGGQ